MFNLLYCILSIYFLCVMLIYFFFKYWCCAFYSLHNRLTTTKVDSGVSCCIISMYLRCLMYCTVLYLFYLRYLVYCTILYLFISSSYKVTSLLCFYIIITSTASTIITVAQVKYICATN